MITKKSVTQEVYGWKAGARHRTNPQVAFSEMQKVKEEAGKLTPSTLLEAVRANPAMALHAEYTWDKDEASYKYWIIESRETIDNLVVVETSEVPNPGPVRAWVSVVVDGSRQFEETAYAVAVPDLHEQIRRQMISDILALERRYQYYSEFANEVNALKGIAGSLRSAKQTQEAAGAPAG